MAQPTLVLEFVEDRPTKNTVKFSERPAEDGPFAVGTLYVQKWAMRDLGNPRGVRVTIEPLES